MSKDVSEKYLRLKYRGKYLNMRLTLGEEGLLNLDVVAPVSGYEKDSFKKLATLISRMVYSGIRSKRSIIGKIDRTIGVDHDVLVFMRKVVLEQLPLEN